MLLNSNTRFARTRRIAHIALRGLLVVVSLTTAAQIEAHGDVTPQAVDTHTLPKLGEAWRTQNPYRDLEPAIKIGSSAYNQNCARCHGLQAVSGGIAPDLRWLDRDCTDITNAAKKEACYQETDQYFLASIRHGKVRNGAVYMPAFESVFSQEAMWAIKAYLETRRAAD